MRPMVKQCCLIKLTQFKLFEMRDCSNQVAPTPACLPSQSSSPKQAGLCNLDLHQLISDQQRLTTKISDLNQKGMLHTDDQQYEEALLHFSEAERILEYAANCGKTLDRVLITTTIRNLSCIYQRLWELPVCLDYIEALLLNLACYRDNEVLHGFQQKIGKDPQFTQQFTKFLNRKLLLGISNLQLSALRSQTGDNHAAYKAAQDSLEVFHSLATLLQAFQKATSGRNSELILNLNHIFTFDPNELSSETVAKQAKSNIQRMKQHRHFFSFDTTEIIDLSIGHIMQIEGVTVDEAKDDLAAEWFISQQGLIYQSIYISCAYFILATESRHLHREGQTDIALSKLFHLHSINIASGLTLLETSYLLHIINSFKTNFSEDLFLIEGKQANQNLLKKVKGPFQPYKMFYSRQLPSIQSEDFQQISEINFPDQEENFTKIKTNERIIDLQDDFENQETIKNIKSGLNNIQQKKSQRKKNCTKKRKFQNDLKSLGINKEATEISEFIIDNDNFVTAPYFSTLNKKQRTKGIGQKRSRERRTRSKSSNQYGIRSHRKMLNNKNLQNIVVPKTTHPNQSRKNQMKKNQNDGVIRKKQKESSKEKKLRKKLTKAKSLQFFNGKNTIDETKLEKIKEQYFLSPSKIMGKLKYIPKQQKKRKIVEENKTEKSKKKSLKL